MWRNGFSELRLVSTAGIAAGVGWLLCASPGVAVGQLTTPTDWRWITDRPAAVVTTQEVPDSAWRFVTMPPGWHVTTGPGALVFHPGFEGRGRYSVEAEIFLFPGDSEAEYGLFVGGTSLETTTRSYAAFVVRRDGSAAIIVRRGAESLFVLPWSRAEAVVPHTGQGTAKNVLRVEVDADRVVFRANGAEIGAVSRTAVPVEGRFGFRVGARVNLHASALDVTHHLALPPHRNPQ